MSGERPLRTARAVATPSRRRSRRGFAAAAVVFAITAGCASSPEPEWDRAADAADGLAPGAWTVAPYEGKYSGDPRLAPSLQRLSTTLPAAIARLHRRLGDDLTLPPLGVSVVDGETAPTWHADGISAISGFVPAASSVKTTRGRSVGVVVLASEPLVADSADLEGTLTHECVHLLHAAGAGYDRTPLWVCEGMADWTEMERREDVDEFLLSFAIRFEGAPRKARVSELLVSERALEGADELATSVAGTFVFFALEQTRGQAFVRELVVRLLREPDWRRVVESACGESVESVLAEARREYEDWTTQMRPCTEALSRASRALAAGEYEGALREADALLADSSHPAMRPAAEYVRWNAKAASGDRAGALAGIREFRDAHPHHPLVAYTRQRELEFLREEERWAETADLARSLGRDYLWSASDAKWREYVDAIRAEAESKLAAGK